MTDCLFCKIVKGEVPSIKVYEDNEFLAFLDIVPINKGHTLVIPKKHSVNIYDTDDEILKKMGPLLKKLSLAIKKSTNADGINVSTNVEKAAGQVVFHLHFHIMPRFEEDGHKHWHGSKLDFDEGKKIAENIRKQLD